jgi:hypothetical protein
MRISATACHAKTKTAGSDNLATQRMATVSKKRLDNRLGLAQTRTAVAVFPLAALFQQLDALKALQHVALGRDPVVVSKTRMLAHDLPVLLNDGQNNSRIARYGNAKNFTRFQAQVWALRRAPGMAYTVIVRL